MDLKEFEYFLFYSTIKYRELQGILQIFMFFYPVDVSGGK